VVAIAGLATRRRWRMVSIYCAALGLFLAWFSTISPSSDRTWAPEVARNVTAVIEGDRVVVSNVRNFSWRSETDFDAVWEQRRYTLSQLRDVDLIMSYWAGEA